MATPIIIPMGITINKTMEKNKMMMMMMMIMLMITMITMLRKKMTVFVV